MDLFFLLLTKLVPLYFTIGLGFISGRVLGVDRDSVSKIVFFIIVPMVFFTGTAHAPLTPAVMMLPVFSLVLSSLLCVGFYWIGSRFYTDATKNLLAMSAGNANTGYFGVPIALMLFDKETFGIYMVLILGVSIFENTVGYYVGALGKSTPREALMKVLKLPLLYGFMLGLLVNLSHIPIPTVMDEFLLNVRGSYSILGMMIIGLGLASLKQIAFDWRFVSLSFFAKFVVFPALAIGFVQLDATYLGWFTENTHKTIILYSLLPMAANVVVIATLLGAHPEKAASTVFLSTMVGAMYVPLMIAWWM
jgi:predicted permease